VTASSGQHAGTAVIEGDVRHLVGDDVCPVQAGGEGVDEDVVAQSCGDPDAAYLAGAVLVEQP